MTGSQVDPRDGRFITIALLRFQWNAVLRSLRSAGRDALAEQIERGIDAGEADRG